MKWKQAAVSVVAGVSLLGLGFWFGNASASTNDPGSAADPLVSKSYVDERLAGVADKAYVDGKLAFQVVNVPKGSALIGEAGTEIVLRGGKASAIASALGGLFDATGGTDVTQGEAVKPNHLLVVPRADERGLLATTDLILLVKGSYSVKAGSQ